MSIVQYSSSSSEDEDDYNNDYGLSKSEVVPRLANEGSRDELPSDGVSKNNSGLKRHINNDLAMNSLPSKRPSVSDERENSTGVAERLPLPSDIRSMFSEKEAQARHKDDVAKHEGRMRSFAHERGNWATCVYIPFDKDSDIEELVQELILTLSQLKLKFTQCDDLHLSLSRTFVIKHHWIEPLVEDLTGALRLCKSGIATLDKVELYCNDEATRTFVAIRVNAASGLLQSYTQAVDSCLTQFKLPLYYENPSHHISLAWCLGDVREAVHKLNLLPMLQKVVDKYFTDNPTEATLSITNVHLKTGNKQFSFGLT